MDFLESSLGRKYLQLSKESPTSTLFAVGFIKQACEAAGRDLDPDDKRSIERACPSS
jgi:hypothetical protein